VIHSTQMYIPLKPLFSKHKGGGVQFNTEPTGNLDEETAMSIMQILEDSVHQMNKCAVIVTHSNEIAKKADVVFQLKRGTLHIVKNNEKV
jgi:ABC-type lipoprotein export system ATPase subunit